MNIIFVLIPLGLMLLATAICAFFWAVRSGQFDDLDVPAAMILFDDELSPGLPDFDAPILGPETIPRANDSNPLAAVTAPRRTESAS